MWRRSAAIVVAIGLAFTLPTPAAAQGGPPMLTDDPGTPGNGIWEINVAGTGERSRVGNDYETPLVDVNYGLGERLQLKIEGPLAGEESARGTWRVGPTTVAPGVKWRFLDQGPRSPVSVSTFPAVELHRDAPPEYALPLEVAREFGRFAANADAGATWNGRRPGEWFYGLAVGFQPSDATELVGEVHAITARDGTGTEALLNAGLRRQLAGFLLLASAGHSIAEPAGEPPKTIFYLGFSYVTPHRR